MKEAILTGLLEATTESLVELRLEREKLRAINAELVAALQVLLICEPYPKGTIGWIWQEDARKAIAKASGATP